MILHAQDYPIYLGQTADYLPQWLANNHYSSIAILVDENTRQSCLPHLLEQVADLKTAHILEIRSGEQNKNLSTCSQLWQTLLDLQTDRRMLLLNLGGGVIGDMGGFVAATYKRGIDFVQIPTTLLSQVDASIGGKLGIDFGDVKNSIGVFQNPKAVFVDTHYLQTLAFRQLRNGFAEMLKHALIADANYWEQLQSIDLTAEIDWQKLIYTSLVIKKKIVETDPLEKGLRKILNFGHTIGHAIESYSLQNDQEPLLHGEAVALGMIAETNLSAQIGLLSNNKADMICNHLAHQFPPYHLPDNALGKLHYYLQNDKKNTQNELRFSLLTDIGMAVYDRKVALDQLRFNY